MGMKALYELRDMLCSELDEIAHKGEMSAGDLETVHKLTDTIKNIDKIEMLESDGYSRSDGDVWTARGNYGRGSSYARRGTHYVRGHYSRDDGRDAMLRRVQEMMDDADDRDREIISRCYDALKNA
nr:MAG TPA: hypothetical protein [Caudoviricetes sp.]